jgi:putative endonuclease
MDPVSNVERGRAAESLAAAYLELSGYRILERNFRSARLEIDLVARTGNLIAIVEVKYRHRSRLGGAVGAVGTRKQRDLETAALGYLRARNLRGVAVRFDVVTLETTGPGRLTVTHIRGAFPASGRYRM